MIVYVTGPKKATPKIIARTGAEVRALIRDGHDILTGDSDGVERAVVAFCDEAQYERLTCRSNNVGDRKNTSLYGQNMRMGYDDNLRMMNCVRDAASSLFIWDGRDKATKAAYDYAVERGTPAVIIVMARETVDDGYKLVQMPLPESAPTVIALENFSSVPKNTPEATMNFFRASCRWWEYPPDDILGGVYLRSLYDSPDNDYWWWWDREPLQGR